jgi:hypothetical protein
VITASDWRPVVKNSLQGWCVLELSPSGIILRDCSLHERDGARRVALPSKPQLDAEGRHRKDTSSGKLLWSPVVEIIKDKSARERFQAAALAAIDKLRGES